MNKAILTLPMMPVDGNNYGKYVTPIICETIGNILEANYYHCINVLDSFNDRTLKLPVYLKSLEENYIHFNGYWYDNEHTDDLLENIDTLIKNGYIFEAYSDIYKCDCGIVEIEENKINTCNPNNLKFKYDGGKMVCKYCGTECRKYHEKILAFVPRNVLLTDIKAYPYYLNKDIKTYEQTVLHSYVTLSRSRNTGVNFVYNGTTYNIDIDFLWATYLNLFSEEEKIVVSGNRMLYQLFLVAVLEKCLEPKNNTIILGTPYITNIKSIMDNPKFIDKEDLRKLFILFNNKWAKKEITCDMTILDYLYRMDSGKRKQLFNIVNRPFKEDLSFVDSLNEVARSQLNMQNSVKTLRLERR